MSAKSNFRLEKIKFVLIFLTALLVFVFGILGFKEITGDNFNIFGAIYSTICLFLLGTPDPIPGSAFLLIARYLALILFGLGALSLVFDRVHHEFIIAKIRFTYKGHIVVITLNEIGYKLVKQLLEKGHKVVIIENNKENNFIYQTQELGGLVIIGNGSDGHIINDAGLAMAKTCIICGDSDHKNMEIANEVLFFRKKKETQESLKIHLHIKDNNNINILKDYLDIHNQDEDYDLETFNVSQLAARMIYDLYPVHEFLNPDKDEEGAIAVIGYNQAAEEFLLENIILSHYPELNNLKIYLIDKDADTHVNEFNFKYPFHSEFIDLYPVKLLNGSFYANFAWSKKDIEKLSKVKAVYLFGNSDSELLTTATNLRQFLYNQTQSISQIPILICLPEDAGITDLLDSNRDSKTNASYVFSKRLNIQLFHMITDTCTIRNLLEQTEQIDTLSKIINYYYSMKYEFSHELKEHWKVQNADLLVNELESSLHELSESNEKISERTIQKRIIMLLSKKTGIHYNSLYSKLSVEKRWNILTHRKKDSNRYAARQLSSKFSSLKRIGCEPLTVENIIHYYARLAPMEHKRWTAEKMVFNYKYGPLVSDKADRYVLKDVLKIHDQLIPYDKLTEIEKEKDLNLFLLLPLLSRIYKSN